MVFTNDFKFPSEEELTTQECPLGTPYIRAGAHHLGRYCEAQNNEFMLCRHETKDPIKCLPEGKVVTSCTNEFFKKVLATCFFYAFVDRQFLNYFSGKGYMWRDFYPVCYVP